MGGSAISNAWELTTNGDRTLLLVGRTGDGKSATGNSILGWNAFTSMHSSSGVTNTCDLRSTPPVDGRILNVIDTPGLFNISHEPDDFVIDVVKCMDLAKDGIHAVLIVLSIRTRFSREELAAVQTFQALFGNKICDYMIVVFTGGDELEENDESLDDYLGRCPEPLKDTLNMCGNRKVVFDNKTKDPSKIADQLRNLLLHVSSVVEKNGGPYTKDLFIESKMEIVRLQAEQHAKAAQKKQDERHGEIQAKNWTLVPVNKCLIL